MSNPEKQPHHIFIVNPIAGVRNSIGEIEEKIKSRKAKHTNETIDIHMTTGNRDATDYIRKYAAEHADEQIRFYACGGDGTLNEVANGAVGLPNVEIGCYACGSGNDYVKIYGGKDKFLDVDDLIEGQSVPVDLMKTGDRYAINATHFGFDSAVAKTMIDVKFKKLIGGKNAYTTGVIKSLFCAMKNKCSVFADGEQLGGSDLLLCTVTCGQYVGGSYRCAPRSLPDDGFLEVCHVRSVSIPTFLKLMGNYQIGKHLTDRRFEKFITYRRAKKVEMVAPDGLNFSLDGELIRATHLITEVVPNAVRFIIPKGAAFIGTYFG